MLAAAVSGCATQTYKLEPQVVMASDLCTPQAATVRVIRDASMLPTLIKPRYTQSIEGARRSGSGRIPAGHQIVLVAMGQRPTPGYGLNLETGAVATLRDGELMLPVQAEAPPVSVYQSPVETSPCIVVAVPTQQKIRSVKLRAGVLNSAP